MEQEKKAEEIFQLALQLQQAGNLQAALVKYRESLQYNANRFQPYANMGLIYKQIKDFDQSLEHFEKAYFFEKQDPRVKEALRNALVQCARLAREQRDMDKAAKLYRRLLSLYPDEGAIHTDLLEVEMQRGNLYEGFREMEWRKNVFSQTNHYVEFAKYPQWQGEIFSGKRLLVYCEQGLGDTLQFIRYLPQVKARGGHVTLGCQGLLVDFLKNHPAADEVQEVIQPQAYDYLVALMSLPLIFGTTLASVPNQVPYLKAPQEKVRLWQERLQSETRSVKVGIVWSGKTTTILNRSCHPREFAPLASVQGVTFYSLQIGEDAAQLQEAPDGMEIIDLSKKIENFSDTAGILMNLDLVISIDTSVPHLAGALGVPVWLALPFDNEWRWMAAGERSAWYPTMRLFRQKQEGVWGPVFSEIASSLEIFISEKINSEAIKECNV